MSAETADNAGTPQSKLLVMVNIKKFPRGINSDQAISLINPDGENESVRPGPGLKLQAAGVKLSNQPVQVSSDKHPNHNHKRQASSPK